MADLPEGVIATALATTYTIAISGGDPDLEEFNHHVLMMTVERRGPDRWAICRHRQCLNVEGEWSYEFNSSDREEDWLATHRFDLGGALRLAQAEALRIYANKRARFAEIGEERLARDA